jgi:hypothetical protein
LNNGTVSAAAFFLVALPVYYAFLLLLANTDSVALGLALCAATLAVLALSSYAVVRYVSRERWTLALVGLRGGSPRESFLLASAVSLPAPLLELYIIESSGLGSLTRGLLDYGGSLGQILGSLPASIAFFSVLGVVVFGLFQALPCALLGRYRLRWVFLPVLAMWVVLYGAEASPGDLAVLGVGFLLVFLRTRSSVGPMLAYVLLAETPAWAALAVLSPGAFVLSLYVKLAWSLAAIGLTVWAHRDGRGAPARESSGGTSTAGPEGEALRSPAVATVGGGAAGLERLWETM